MRPNDFCWATPAACEWRTRIRAIPGLHGIQTPEKAREAWGSKWAFRLTGVLSDLINSAHLLSEIEFAQVARIWSEDAMLDPLWWRTWEDRCREEECSPVPIIAEIPEDVQEFLALAR